MFMPRNRTWLSSVSSSGRLLERVPERRLRGCQHIVHIDAPILHQFPSVESYATSLAPRCTAPDLDDPTRFWGFDASRTSPCRSAIIHLAPPCCLMATSCAGSSWRCKFAFKNGSGVRASGTGASLRGGIRVVVSTNHQSRLLSGRALTVKLAFLGTAWSPFPSFLASFRGKPPQRLRHKSVDLRSDRTSPLFLVHDDLIRRDHLRVKDLLGLLIVRSALLSLGAVTSFNEACDASSSCRRVSSRWRYFSRAT